jgi:hypothetical protein
MNCSTCIYANKSGSDDHVFCTYWQNKCNESKQETKAFIQNKLFKQTLLQNVGLGWGYPNKHFYADSHWSYKGTASEGLMWANQICIHKNESCQHQVEPGGNVLERKFNKNFSPVAQYNAFSEEDEWY